jgi:hypothetical protein
MFTVTVGNYTLLCHPDALPDLYPNFVGHARLVDEVDLSRPNGKTCFLAVRQGAAWPSLVVALRYSPAVAGFHPGALVVPETGLLFVGAGVRLLAYQLDPPARLWQDEADTGFWGWERHGDFVVMGAELELAAWGVDGRKRWTTFVQPPWEYAVQGDTVHLDVMGRRSSFPLATGPATDTTTARTA